MGMIKFIPTLKPNGVTLCRWALLLSFAIGLALLLGPSAAEAQAPGPLGNPANLTATPGGYAGEVSLRWTPAANATVHWVYYLDTTAPNSLWTAVKVGGGNVSAAEIPGLMIGTTYRFVVRASQQQPNGSTTWSEWSAPADATPAMTGTRKPIDDDVVVVSPPDDQLTSPMIYWTDSDAAQIWRANLDGSDAQAIVTSGLRHPASLALDVLQGKMYWTDYGTGKIQRANLNGAGVEDLVTELDDPIGIALDTSDGTGKIYWSGSGNGKIQYVNLDSPKTIRDLITGLDSPHHLVLDTSARRIYWTTDDWLWGGKIQYASLDSPHIVRDLVTPGVVSPNGLALDVSGRWLYWTDHGSDTIQRASLDAHGAVISIEPLITSGLQRPGGIALDATGRMYWTDYGTRKIQSAAPTAKIVSNVITSGLEWPLGIAIASPSKPSVPAVLQSASQLYWVDEKAQKIQRTITVDDAQVVDDLTTSEQRLDMPGSIALDPLAGKMYWTDEGDGDSQTSDGAIRRANRDGSGVENVKAGLRDPVGIALDLDNGYLYWVDRHWGNIYRGRLRDIGNLTAETVVDDSTKPYQIALDTANGYIYWTERGGSKIRRANLKADDVAAEPISFSPVGPQNPFGLALDPVAGKMYWTERNTGGDSIRSADLDGQNSVTLVDSEPHSLSGIAVDVNDGKIYWSDEVAGAIRRIDPADPDAVAEDVVTGLAAPEGVAVARPYLSRTRLALIALYRATDGDNWTNNDGWLSDQLPGTWRGISTDDKQGLITGLDLSGNNLVGELPATLGNLKNLCNLDLSGNQLTGAIPTEWADGFEVLKDLNLSYNRLNGELPAGLGNHHLEMLNLSGNQLRGEIPTELGSLVRLTELNLSHNELSGSIPYKLSSSGDLAGCEKLGQTVLNQRALDILKEYAGSLANLEILDLSDNKLRGTIPPTLCSLTDLDTLDLGRNRLTGSIPPELGKLAELRALRLNGQSPYNKYLFSGHEEEERLEKCQDDCYLHGAIPPALGSLNQLEELDLSDNRLSGAIPPELGGLLTVRSDLTDLNLSHNNLGKGIPVELGRLIHLETLDVSHNRLEGLIPKSLGRLSNLKLMYIHANPLLSGCVPRYLEGVRGLEIALNDHQGNLQGFCLSSGEASDKAVLEILYRQTNGQGWHSEGRNEGRWLNENWGSGWYGVKTEHGRVVELDLGDNNLVGTLPPELRDLTELRSLNLSSNELSGSITWLSGLSNLEYLDLSDNLLLGEFPIKLGNLTELREVRLQGNDLSGWIPEQFAALARQSDGTGGKLEKMFLHNNGFTGCIPIGLEGPLDAAEAERSANAVQKVWQKEINLQAKIDLGEHGVHDNTILQKWTPIISSVEVGDSFGVEDVLIAGMNKVGVGSAPAVRLLRHFIHPSYGLGLPPCAPRAPAPKGWVQADSQSYKTDRAALLSMCQLKVASGADCLWTEEEMKKPLQEWHGVHTERFQVGGKENWKDCGDAKDDCRVTRLKLVGKNWRGQPTDLMLTGEIPPELGNLGELKVLNLSKNNLYGEIPTELGNLRNLYSLALNDNNLTGKIPPELGNLGGRLDDLSAFSGLDNLLDLHLQENSLTGDIPQELSNVGYLRTVLVDPQRDAKGKEYKLEGCLHSSVALDGIRSVHHFAFDYVFGKISAAIDDAIKKKLRNTDEHKKAKASDQERVVREVNDLRENEKAAELDLFQEAQVKYAAGLRFDAQMDDEYGKLIRASGFSDALSKVGAELKKKVLNFGGAGDFEDVACQ